MQRIAGKQACSLFVRHVLSSAFTESSPRHSCQAISKALSCRSILWLAYLSRRIAERTGATAALEEPPAVVPDDGIDQFSRAYKLSENETRVLRLTVRGRTRQRIAETLYVSAGTVNTYLHRIYQKAGVHSRQELLDKIEEFPGMGTEER